MKKPSLRDEFIELLCHSPALKTLAGCRKRIDSLSVGSLMHLMSHFKAHSLNELVHSLHRAQKKPKKHLDKPLDKTGKPV